MLAQYKGAYMYQVLARKYRPRNFSQLVGQQHVSKALSNALERGRLHHAYLFTGTRGVGKTTIARILAKCLNCETGVTATPCEQCTVCTAVNEGRFIDLIEIDAASRTRVEDTRELLDNVPYAPTQGRYKVYLIDEVHMLSTHSFNALLKTLEEPPEHVKFLFATTDPQKLPITVISRCLQFTLRPLAKDEIFKHLDEILNTEQIPHNSEALWQLAESAQGSLRDALSLTDQAIAYGQGQVFDQDVKDMLGLVDNRLVTDLLIAIYQNQRSQVATLIQSMRKQAIDVVHVLEQLISTLHDVAVLQCLGQALEQQQAPEQQQKTQLAELIAAQDIQLYYQIAVQGRADLALALTPEQGFEMCILRLLAFRPLAQGEVTVQQQLSTTPQTAVQLASSVNANTNEHIEPQQQQALDTALSEVPEPRLQEQQDVQDGHDSHADQVVESLSASSVVQHQQEQPIADTNEQAIAMDVSDHSKIEDAVAEIEIPQQQPSDVVNNHIATNQSSSDIEPSHVDESESASTEVASLQQQQDILQQQTVSTVVDQPDDDVKAVELLQNIHQDEFDPRDLLAPTTQDLTGQWTLEKWDYWLRQSNLSPAVQELAQHAVIKGDIAGQSELIVDASYQRMFEGFAETIKQQLKNLNDNLQLQISYQVIDEPTPLQLQQQRKQQAYATAQEKITDHAVVKAITEEFSASIVELKFKN